MLKSDAKVAATIIFAATINSAPTVKISCWESLAVNTHATLAYMPSTSAPMTMTRNPEVMPIVTPTVIANVSATVHDIVSGVVSVVTTTAVTLSKTESGGKPTDMEGDFPDFDYNDGARDDPFTPVYTTTTPTPIIPADKNDAPWAWMYNPSELSLVAFIMLLGNLDSYL